LFLLKLCRGEVKKIVNTKLFKFSKNIHRRLRILPEGFQRMPKHLQAHGCAFAGARAWQDAQGKANS
jgi:hypothetical protein